MLQKLYSLLYEDDIIMFSSTQEGLQHSLNVLSNVCSSWKLDVNQVKSKAIVFNSNGKTYIGVHYDSLSL
jgi:hypothetical protein